MELQPLTPEFGERLTPLSRQYRFEAYRSLTIVIAVPLIGSVWLPAIQLRVAIAAAAAGVVLVGAWSHLAHRQPELGAMEGATRLAVAPPNERTLCTSLRVLRRLPLAGIAILLTLTGWDLAGLDPAPLLSAVVALVAGLAYTRLRRARAVTMWEAEVGETALVAGDSARGMRYRVRRTP